MKRLLVPLFAGLVLVTGALPAGAAQKKTVTEEWDVVAVPFPGADDHSDPAAECGVEGVSYDIYQFTTPAKGKLDVRLTFQAEWDLYVTDGDGNLLGSSVNFMSTPEERVQLSVGAKVELNIYSCNFLGGPTAHGTLKYTYKA